MLHKRNGESKTQKNFKKVRTNTARKILLSQLQPLFSTVSDRLVFLSIVLQQCAVNRLFFSSVLFTEEAVFPENSVMSFHNHSL
jgi:hypothetical protein